MIFSVEQASRISRRLMGVGNLFVRLYPSLRYDLRSAGLELEAGAYAAAALISSIMWGVAMYAFSYLALYSRG